MRDGEERVALKGRGPPVATIYIQAIEARTGRVAAVLAVSDDDRVATRVGGRTVPGFAGPFDEAAEFAANNLVAERFPDRRGRPRPWQLEERGELTAWEVAEALPDGYNQWDFVRTEGPRGSPDLGRGVPADDAGRTPPSDF